MIAKICDHLIWDSSKKRASIQPKCLLPELAKSQHVIYIATYANRSNKKGIIRLESAENSSHFVQTIYEHETMLNCLICMSTSSGIDLKFRSDIIQNSWREGAAQLITLRQDIKLAQSNWYCSCKNQYFPVKFLQIALFFPQWISQAHNWQYAPLSGQASTCLVCLIIFQNLWTMHS